MWKFSVTGMNLVLPDR